MHPSNPSPSSTLTASEGKQPIILPRAIGDHAASHVLFMHLSDPPGILHCPQWHELQRFPRAPRNFL